MTQPTDSGLKARPLLFLYDLPDGGKLRLVKESAFDQEHARAETAEAKLHALESQLKQAKEALDKIERTTQERQTQLTAQATLSDNAELKAKREAQ